MNVHHIFAAKCDGGYWCCGGDYLCGQGEGDCDSDGDCLSGLRCDFDGWWGRDYCQAGRNWETSHYIIGIMTIFMKCLHSENL